MRGKLIVHDGARSEPGKLKFRLSRRIGDTHRFRGSAGSRSPKVTDGHVAYRCRNPSTSFQSHSIVIALETGPPQEEQNP